MVKTAYGQPVVREAVAVFDREEEMHAAMDELQRSGFDRAELSGLPRLELVEKLIGHKLQSIVEVEDNPDIPRAGLIDMGSFGIARGVMIGVPLYIGACGAIINPDFSRGVLRRCI